MRARDRWRAAAVVLIAGALTASGVRAADTAPSGASAPHAAIVGGPAAAFAAGPVAADPVPDPFPIRRVFAPADRLPDLLSKAQRGALVRIPRSEFEAKIRAAAAASGPSPRVVEARYRAVFADGGLRGTADWRLARGPAGGGPRLMPVAPLSVAVGNPRWAGRGPALVYAGADGYQLLVDAPGEATLSLDWSVRGVEEPSADRFDLALPPATVTTLEVDLPADRVLAATAEALVTGPFPAAAGDRRVWRVALGGGPRFGLVVRRVGTAGRPAPAVRVRRTARIDVSPGIAACTYELDLEPVRELPEGLTLEVGPGLRVTSVTGRDRLGWYVEPGGGPTSPTRVRVAPLGGAGRVVVTGFAAAPAGGAGWPCPQVRVADGLPGGDAIDVRLSPDVTFIGCDPGEYRVVTAAADRGYRVQLDGAPLPAGADRAARRPPVLRFRAEGPEYSAVETVTWRVGDDATKLTCRFRVHVTRGPLARIPVAVSAGYVAASWALTPDDPGATWVARPDGGLVVEPTRPVGTGQSVELEVVFRGPPAPAAGSSRVPFPRASLPGAAAREGTLTIAPGPPTRVWAAPAPAGPTGPLVYPYRGASPEGTVAVDRRRPTVSVLSDTRVSRDGGALAAATTLRVRADGGVPALVLFTPRPRGEEWDVRVDEGSARPVPGGELAGWSGLLAADHPWSAAAGAGYAAAVRGSLWHVALPRASADEITITARSRRPAPASESVPAEVPIPTVLGAEPTSATVSAAPPLAGQLTAPQAPAAGEFPMSARLGSAHAPAPPDGGHWQATDLRLVSRVEPDGGLRCQFSGRVTAAAGTALPVELPAGAAVEWVTVASKYVARVEPAAPADDRSAGAQERVRIPVPAAPPGGVPFEIHYRLPAPRPGSWFPWPVIALESPIPTIPGGEADVATEWEAGPGFRLRAVDRDRPTRPTRSTAVAVRSSALVAAGYALAAAVAGAALALAGGRTAARPAGLFFVVGVLAVTARLAPAWWEPVLRPPLVAGLLAATGFVVFAARRPAAPPGSTVSHHAPPAGSRRGLPALLVSALAVLAVPAGAQGPEPVTVFVVPGHDGDPGRLSVLAAPGTLRRLDDLARPPGPTAAITAAEYDGRLVGPDAAEFTVTYHLHCPRDGESSLVVPLSGVRLVEMALDGRAAYPDGSQPDQYAVTVRGAGRHELTARFLAVPAAVGADREVRFEVPDVPVCRVRFAAPPDTGRVDVASRRGAQTVARGDQVRTDADHGGGKAVVVRWRSGDTSGAPAVVTVKEACVWDLSAAGEAATAAFVFRVEAGAASKLAVEIPDGLEPDTPVVRGVAAPAGATRDGPGLRSWAVSGPANGWRTVHLELQSPAEGRVAVILRLVPRRLASARPVLRFPRAAGVARADSFYGIRTADLAVASLTRTGVIDYTPEALAREFAVIPELQLDRRPADQAFQRAGGPAEVVPTVEPLTEPGAGSAEVVWVVGRRAEAAGTVRVTRPATPVVEFDLPAGVRLDDVRATDMQSWHRSGTRVQVWLRKPTDAVEVQWAGVLAGDLGGGGGPAQVELPFPRLAAVVPDAVTVRVRPAAGWAVLPAAPAPAPPGGSDATAAYRLPPQAPFPQFRVYPPAPPDVCHLWEQVERSGAGLRYHARVTVPLAAGRPHHFTLTLAGVPAGPGVTAQGPDAATVSPARAGPGSAAWDVSVAAAAGPLTFHLSAPVPASGPLPEVSVTFDGPPVAWGTRAMSTTDPTIAPRPLPSGWRPALPGDRDRLRAAWPEGLPAGGDDPVWVADAAARPWAVSASPVPLPAPPGPAAGPDPSGDLPLAPAGLEDATAGPGAPPQGVGGWAVAGVWAAGLAGLLALTIWRRPGWWADRMAVCGVLGALALGTRTEEAAVFWVVAAAGAVARLGWLVRRAARAVSR